MRFITGAVIAVGLTLGCALKTSAAAPAPARAAPAGAAAAPAGAANKINPNQGGPVVDAAKALLKEYQTIMKEKKGEGLREKCDYFGEKKPEGVNAETVLAVLEKPIPGATDPRAEAYVKWQLLSGVDGKFSEALKPRAIRVYNNAPRPRPNPGLNRAELDRKLNRDVGLMNKEAEPEINKQYQAAITAWRVEVEPLLSYRDEFYNRLPPSYDTFVAGLTDIYDRVTRGAPANEFWTTLGGAIRSWALTANDARQLGTLAGAVNKIKDTIKDEHNKPYAMVRWEKSDHFIGLKWHSEQTIRELRSVEDVAALLEERSNNPGSGGLGFKDDKEMKKK
jgi:hypothetical protein